MHPNKPDKPSINDMQHVHAQHPSILAIQQNIKVPLSFEFKYIKVEDIEKALRSLNLSKSTGPDAIPAKALRICASQLAPVFTLTVNKSIDNSLFLDDMKQADISPIYKKLDALCKDNYRPVNVLNILSRGESNAGPV